MKENEGILLESGIGEFEILKFTVNGKHYAINVIKVREILQIDKLSEVPNSPEAISGITLVRGEVVTVIDLKYVLEKNHYADSNHKMTLLCEFNQLKVAFLVDEVLGIHRIRWDQMQKPDDILNATLVVGNINLDNAIYMMLDFEKIVMDISPQTGITTARIAGLEAKDRTKVELMLADDSPMIRQVLRDTLTYAGFTKLRFFDDGQQALDYLMTLVERKGEAFTEDVQLLITDIEMPQLDGHTLTRRIKEHKILKKLPIIIFSSLITDSLKHKGDSVGADAQMSKPEIGRLVLLIDKLLKI